MLFLRHLGAAPCAHESLRCSVSPDELHPYVCMPTMSTMAPCLPQGAHVTHKGPMSTTRAPCLPQGHQSLPQGPHVNRKGHISSTYACMFIRVDLRLW
ncbi:unnamed protein product [Gadus morhua 'NCC']